MATILQVPHLNNRVTGSTYSYAQFESDFGSGLNWGSGFGLNHAEIEYDSVKGNVIKMRFPANTFSTSPNAGFDEKVFLPSAPYEEIYMRCYLKLGDESNPFDAVKGGKLTGLTWDGFTGAGTPPTGTNGGYLVGGFAYDSTYYPHETLEIICYHPDQVTNGGDNFGERWKLEDPANGVSDAYSTPANMIVLPENQWFEWKVRCKMNTSGVADGVLQVWIDGNLRVDVQNLDYRDAGQTWGIDRFDFVFFYGGGDSSYAPSTDQYIYFTDLLIKDTEITEGGYRSSTSKVGSANNKLYTVNTKFLIY